MATEPVVLSHWFKLVEGLDASSLDFYESVEGAVARRELPETERSRVDYYEGGAFSAKREYLRVKRQRLVFDVGGGSFGNSFFVCWWLGELRAGPWLLLGVLGGLMFFLYLAFQAGWFIGFVALLLGVPLILLYLARNPPEGLAGWDDPILSVPFVGIVYQRVFRPVTRYKIDTIKAFQQAVHSAVLEVVDDLTKTKGLRALSEVERQPVLGEFFQR